MRNIASRLRRPSGRASARGQKTPRAAAGAVFPRHKGQYAMTFVVLHGSLCQWEKRGKSEQISAIFANPSPWPNGFFPRQSREAPGITAKAFIEFGDVAVEIRVPCDAYHVATIVPNPRHVRRCCQVTLVSISRSKCRFDKALWNTRQRRTLRSFVGFWSLASISRQPLVPEEKRPGFARSASVHCKHARPIGRSQQSQSTMSHGVKLGV